MKKLTTPEEIEASRQKRSRRENEWKRANYEQIAIRFKPGVKGNLETIAEEHGYSLRGFLTAIANGDVQVIGENKSE